MPVTRIPVGEVLWPKWTCEPEIAQEDRLLAWLQSKVGQFFWRCPEQYRPKALIIAGTPQESNDAFRHVLPSMKMGLI